MNAAVSIRIIFGNTEIYLYLTLLVKIGPVLNHGVEYSFTSLTCGDVKGSETLLEIVDTDKSYEIMTVIRNTRY